MFAHTSMYVSCTSVTLNALCYALHQAVDYIDVVYNGASEDEELHYLQVVHLANACWEHWASANEAERLNCHWWENHIIDIAKCKTLEEYKAVMEA